MVSNVSRSSGVTPQKILILNLMGITSYILYPFFKSFQHWSFFHLNRNQSEKHQGKSILVIKGEVHWPGDLKGHGPTQQILIIQANRVKTGYDSKMMKGASKTKWDTSQGWKQEQVLAVPNRGRTLSPSGCLSSFCCHLGVFCWCFSQ